MIIGTPSSDTDMQVYIKRSSTSKFKSLMKLCDDIIKSKNLNTKRRKEEEKWFSKNVMIMKKTL